MTLPRYLFIYLGFSIFTNPLIAHEHTPSNEELIQEIQQIKERLILLEVINVSNTTNCTASDFENTSNPWKIHDVSGVWVNHINDNDELLIKKRSEANGVTQFDVIRNHNPQDPWSQGSWTGRCTFLLNGQFYELKGEDINIGGCLHTIRFYRSLPKGSFNRGFTMFSLSDGKPAPNQPSDICETHHELLPEHPGSAHGGND